MNFFYRLPSQYLYTRKRPELVGPENLFGTDERNRLPNIFDPMISRFLQGSRGGAIYFQRLTCYFLKKPELKDHLQTVTRQVKDLVSISFSNNSISSTRFITSCFFPVPLRRRVTVSLFSSFLPITAIKGILDISASRIR